MPALENFLQTSARIARRTAVEGHAVRHAVRAGALGGSSPRTTAAILRAMQRYGPPGETGRIFGVDDEEFGKRLAAYVVLRPGMTLSVDELKEFVKQNLARFKVPRDVAFLEELPRNPTGKVLKRELRERHAEQVGA
jgi:acyl-CoA synthetase (AMP-forming)/AMP-acid ligase II